MTGVTRNKSDIKLESDPLAPFAEAVCSHYQDTTATALHNEYTLCA